MAATFGTAHAERDVIGRDQNTFYQFVLQAVPGTTTWSKTWDGQVQNFLDSYVGTSVAAVPFGGRRSLLKELDSWLAGGTRPYALLVAPAGRGKSALLAQWIRMLARTEPQTCHLVYFPISVRYGTNLETVALGGIAARLARVFGEAPPEFTNSTDLRQIILDYCRRPTTDGLELLLLVDGLDEAAHWELGPDLFPSIPVPGLRILLAARPLPGGQSGDERWRAQLQWPKANVKTFNLGVLSAEEIAEALTMVGPPLADTAKDVQFLRQLHRLTGGDPFILRLYVDALQAHDGKGPVIAPNMLLQVDPGLDSFFQLWFDEQKKLWPASAAVEERRARKLLQLCAAALGPLTKSDVAALAPDSFPDSEAIDSAAVWLRRLLIGEGNTQGLVLFHPRLAEYVLEQLTEGERKQWRARYLAYGKATLNGLKSGQLGPQSAPSYVVQYYGTHLRAPGAPASQIYELISEPWLRAWEALQGSATGFTNDIGLVWETALKQGASAFAELFAAALAVASAGSSIADISGKLLEACLATGTVPPRLALAVARQHTKPDYRAACLAVTAPRLQDAEEQATVWREFFKALEEVDDGQGGRAGLLRHFAPVIPEAFHVAALELARAEESKFRLAAWFGLIPVLKGPERQQAIEETLAAARSDSATAPAFLAQISKVVPERKQEILAEGLHLAASQTDLQRRISGMAAIAQELEAGKRSAVLQEAVSLAQKEYLDKDKARRLRAVIAAWDQDVPTDVVAKAYQSYYAMDEWEHLEALVELAPLLRAPERLEREFDLWLMNSVDTAEEQVLRIKLLCALAKAGSEEMRLEWMPIIFNEALAVLDESSRVLALLEARRISGEEQIAEVDAKVVEVLEFMEYSSNQIQAAQQALKAVKHRYIQRLITVIERSPEHGRAAQALAHSASELTHEDARQVTDAAWRLVRQIGDERSQVRFVAGTVQYLAPAQRADVLPLVTQYSGGLDDEELVFMVGALASSAEPHWLAGLARLTEKIVDVGKRTRAVCSLVGALPEAEREAAWRALALAAVRLPSEQEYSGILAPVMRQAKLEEAARYCDASLFVFLIEASEQFGKHTEVGPAAVALARRVPATLFPEVLQLADASSDPVRAKFATLAAMLPRYKGRKNGSGPRNGSWSR